ncbi:MAG: WD40/YVTN/BNR-like repeat-containing protein, partial [Povalibacter sp.]
IVDGRTLSQRSSKGIWRTVAVSEFDLSCIVNVLGEIYVGTEDAQILRLGANGSLERLPGFDVVLGRDTWYAGTAVVDGKVVGPPLGIRSITATCDGAVLLANVHVGGIPRSTDRGVSWHPTVKVEEDVHEVRAHDTRPDIAIAAAATGLCTSRDGGETWSVEQEGLHACYCSAVAFAGDDILVAASEGHFAAQGAIYRRPIDGPGPLSRVSGGLPEWLDGIVDTACIATHGSMLALADGGGSIYVSEDAGGSWRRAPGQMPSASSVLIV